MSCISKIWLVRHAESLANAGLPTETSSLTPLSVQGRQQARDFAFKLWDMTKEIGIPDMITSSKYIRAIETAKYTKDHMQWVDGEISELYPVHEFTYLCGEKYKGTTCWEREAPKKEYWERGDQYYIDGNGCESFHQMVERAETTIDNIKKLDGFNIIFSHGIFIKAIWYMLLAFEKKDDMGKMYNFMKSIDFPNLGILELKIDGDNIMIRSLKI